MLEQKDLEAIRTIVKEEVRDVVDPQFQHVNELIEINAQAILENREAIGQNREAILESREAIGQNREVIQDNTEAIHSLADHLDRRFNEFQVVMASKDYVTERIARLRLQT